jgi:hypothetical protein
MWVSLSLALLWMRRWEFPQKFTKYSCDFFPLHLQMDRLSPCGLTRTDGASFDCHFPTWSLSADLHSLRTQVFYLELCISMPDIRPWGSIGFHNSMSSLSTSWMTVPAMWPPSLAPPFSPDTNVLCSCRVHGLFLRVAFLGHPLGNSPSLSFCLKLSMSHFPPGGLLWCLYAQCSVPCEPSRRRRALSPTAAP